MQGLLDRRPLGHGESEVLGTLDRWGILTLEQALVLLQLLLVLVDDSVREPRLVRLDQFLFELERLETQLLDRDGGRGDAPLVDLVDFQQLLLDLLLRLLDLGRVRELLARLGQLLDLSLQVDDLRV